MREDGSYLELEAIGGYEIRYKPIGSYNYTSFKILGNRTTQYTIPNYTISSNVEIAIFDIYGIYSAFVPINP